MKDRYWLVLPLSGFVVIFAFIFLLLIPSYVSLRARQTDLLILETRTRVVQIEEASYSEHGIRLQVINGDEFFASLANVRVLAHRHGLNVRTFIASEVDNFGMDVSETTVRASFYGYYDRVIEYLLYLAGCVYNIKYLSLVNAEIVNFEIGFSIYHRR